LSREVIPFWRKRAALLGSVGERAVDKLDREILNIIQSDFPIVSRPFLEVGERLGIEEREVIRRVREMKASGVIRRIGGSFDSRKLGFFSTLCAAKVPQEKVELFNEVINAYPGITHNYMRDHDYNIWFTFIGESQQDVDRWLKDIAARTGVDEIVSLPSNRVFKIRVDFEL
jgi:DNA-binding Lrp family transcriptional regulator